MSKAWKARLVAAAFGVALAAATGAVRAQSTSPATRVPLALTEPAWPRQTVRDEGVLVTYQPQVEAWENFKTLTWRMAFSLTPAGGKPMAGALEMQGRTDIDTGNHMVFIYDLNVQRVYFPSVDSTASTSMEQLVRSFLPSSLEISLDRLIACTPPKDAMPAAQLSNEPPRIFVSYKPAILLDFAGAPALSSIPGTTLELATNTGLRVFRDQADAQYYLVAGGQWLTAPDLSGPWNTPYALPKDIERLWQAPYFRDLATAIPLRLPAAASVVPSVFYSDAPGDVIVFEGEPAYKTIPGTELSYATNTVSYVFRYGHTNQVYYLTAGRWFSASSLDGPWTFASSTLPADFARIPASSPAAQVLASVPGTEEAKDAVLMAQVPVTAVINPQTAAANAQVAYDGEPEFAPIEGTSMHYAVNTGQRVIQVRDQYYLCLQGVWFVSAAPEGPWQTAQSVPVEIYTIPPSSPVYNVTYVTQNVLPDGRIEASYTAGYMGAYVMGTAAGAVLAIGTGYYYPPYAGAWSGWYSAYYTYPGTYGAGAYYNPAANRYGVSQTAYGSYSSVSRWGSYTPYIGTAARGVAVSASDGNAGSAQAYNPYTGAFGAAKQASNAYSNWGSSAVSAGNETAYAQRDATAQRSLRSVKTSKVGVAAGGAGAAGEKDLAGTTEGGDLYAGHDGSVYRNTGSGWEKYGSGGWDSVKPPSEGSAARSAEPDSMAGPSSVTGSEMPGLEKELQSRQRGAQSFERFRECSIDRFGGAGGSGRRR